MIHRTDKSKAKAVLIGVQLPFVEHHEHMASLAELGRLVDTLGFEVLGVLSQRRQSLHAGTVVGQGKLQELAEWTGGTGEVPSLARQKKQKKDEANEPAEEEEEASDASEKPEASGVDVSKEPEQEDAEEEFVEVNGEVEVVIVNHPLTPMQLRNLELATGAEVLDRNGVIIEIFHRHAKTKEARLQIEIAQLKYLAPRLRLSQNRGGDRQAGGIGGKGAGETRRELDQRRIRDRIAELHEQLDAIAKEEKLRRSRRKQANSVALVGYTNAGKSSLMRRLTSDSTYVADKLFATLGTTVRVMQPETKPRILMTDTVGFINELPHELVASFRSTLEEAKEASLLLHVVDVSDPDYRTQLKVTRDVLSELATQDIPLKLIFNKKDLLDDLSLYDVEIDYPDAIYMSAHDPKDIQSLKDYIVSFFEADMVEEELYVPFSQGKWIGEIHSQVRVLETSYDEGGTLLRVRGVSETLEKLRKQISATELSHPG